MHRVVEDGVESYFEGVASPEFRAHLKSCDGCRREIEAMRDLSLMFADLKTEEPVEPHASFTAKVMAGIGQRRAASVWNFFDPAFGRRIAFASLLTLAVLGSFLISRETGYAPAPSSPDVVMANDQQPASPGDMLVTLVSYEQ